MSNAVWEYKTFPVHIQDGLVEDMDLDRQLNAFGQEGWEVYSVTSTVLDGTTRFVVHHLRRLGEPRHRAGFQTD